jgi:hypothetical protein
MSQAISPQHPAVVLRSHYLRLRALLAVAMIAVVSLTAAVAVLATNDDGATSQSSTQPPSAATQSAPGQRYHGAPEEGSADVASVQARLTPEQALREAARAPEDRRRYDGDREEGTHGIQHSSAASGVTSPHASETAGTPVARKQVEIGRSITDPAQYLAFVKSLADYDHARDYGDKR